MLIVLIPAKLKLLIPPRYRRNNWRQPVYLAFSIIVFVAASQFVIASLMALAYGQPVVSMFCSIGLVASTVLATVATDNRPETMPAFYVAFVLSLLSVGTSIAGVMTGLSSDERRELAELAAQPEPEVEDLPRITRSDNTRAAVQQHRARRRRRTFRLPNVHINRNEHAHV